MLPAHNTVLTPHPSFILLRNIARCFISFSLPKLETRLVLFVCILLVHNLDFAVSSRAFCITYRSHSPWLRFYFTSSLLLLFFDCYICYTTTTTTRIRQVTTSHPCDCHAAVCTPKRRHFHTPDFAKPSIRSQKKRFSSSLLLFTHFQAFWWASDLLELSVTTPTHDGAVSRSFGVWTPHWPPKGTILPNTKYKSSCFFLRRRR